MRILTAMIVGLAVAVGMSPAQATFWNFTHEYVVQTDGSVSYTLFGTYTSMIDCSTEWVLDSSSVSSADARTIREYSGSYLSGELRIVNQQGGVRTSQTYICSSFSVEPFVAPLGWVDTLVKSHPSAECEIPKVERVLLPPVDPVTGLELVPFTTEFVEYGGCFTVSIAGPVPPAGYVPFSGILNAWVEGPSVAGPFYAWATCNIAIGGVCWDRADTMGAWAEACCAQRCDCDSFVDTRSNTCCNDVNYGSAGSWKVRVDMDRVPYE